MCSVYCFLDAITVDSTNNMTHTHTFLVLLLISVLFEVKYTISYFVYVTCNNRRCSTVYIKRFVIYIASWVSDQNHKGRLGSNILSWVSKSNHLHQFEMTKDLVARS